MKKFILLGCLLLITACQPATQPPAAESTPTAPLPTAPEPATPTVTFTPTPAWTATPVPMYFTEEFNAGTGAWTSYQTGGESSPYITAENDLLQLSFSSPNTWYYAIHGAHEYQDAAISAKFSGTPSGSVGLVCRYSDTGWLEYNIASNGTYSVLFGQWLGEGIAQYTPFVTDGSEYLQNGTFEYEIGMTCQENFMFLYINGKLFRKLDIARFNLTEGKVGLAIASFEEMPMSVNVDWFKVSEPQAE